MKRTILVAADGTAGSLGALRMAHSLQKRDGVSVEVVGVVEPIPSFDVGMMVTVPDAGLAEVRREGLEKELKAQVRAEAGADWPVSVEAGLPGPRVARREGELGASFLFLGLGRHRTVDRLLGTETALQVTRMATCPVLAVPADSPGHLPTRAVCAVDFSDHGRHAVEAALQLLGGTGTLILAHVLQGLGYLQDVPDGWEGRYRQEVEQRLAEFVLSLNLPSGIQVERYILDGEPAAEILGLADRTGADLVAAGSHGHALVTRIILGSVSTRLLRGASVATLIVPPGSTPAFDRSTGEGAGEAGAHPWVALLAGFNQRHAGRAVTLEFVDPELGAQVTGGGFPLRGIDYDPRSGAVHVMMGPQGGTEGHITHTIRAPAAVEVAPAGPEGAEVLRIALVRGECLLRTHPA